MLRAQLDDVVNAVAIHLPSGVWGVVAVGLFATPGSIRRVYGIEKCASCVLCVCGCRSLRAEVRAVQTRAACRGSASDRFDCGMFYGGSGKQLGVQCLGVAVVTAWSALLTWVVFLVLSRLNWLRIADEVQARGWGLCAGGRDERR